MSSRSSRWSLHACNFSYQLAENFVQKYTKLATELAANAHQSPLTKE